MLSRIALVVAATASPAHAGAHADQIATSIGAPVDVLKFERIASARYHVRFRRIVAADIDRDGDLDVVAATEHGFMVWMNDGSGHLKRQTPRRGPAADGGTPERTWDSNGARREESLQNDLPSASDVATRAHDPPPLDLRLRVPVDVTPRSDAARKTSFPRAPPA